MGPRSSSTEIKTLILIRHAHRHKTLGAHVDNGLSAKGKRQARRIAAYYRRSHGREQPVCLSSPKLRCIETLSPLARVSGVQVEISPLLDEMGSKESSRHFRQRLVEFERWWRDLAPPLVVICTHGDWIPEALALMTGAPIDLKKGGWAELQWDGGEIRLTWLIQDLSSVTEKI